MNKVIKLFQALFIIIFFIVLLYVYAYMEAQVSFNVDGDGKPVNTISKESFFYMSLALFVFSNVVCLALARVINGVPVSSGKNNQPFFSNLSFKENLIDWIMSFNVVLNFSYVCIIIFLGMLNYAEFLQRMNYKVLLYAGPFFIVVWLFLLLTIIIRKK